MVDKLKTELDATTTREATVPSLPMSQLEQELLSIWQRVLGNSQIGTQNDFLALGGDSIQAARILAHVNERFGMDLQISDIFTTPTVAAMANLVETKRNRDLKNE